MFVSTRKITHLTRVPARLNYPSHPICFNDLTDAFTYNLRDRYREEERVAPMSKETVAILNMTISDNETADTIFDCNYNRLKID